MLKFRLLLLSIVFPLLVSGQTVIWFEDFNNGCTDNCSANGYAGVNGAWTVVDVTTPGNFANEWFVSCAENGEPIGSCGAGCGNNATLHVGSVPCSLCLTCPSGDCGAAYNAGPSSLTGEDPTTNKRAISPLINTVGRTNISLHFKYIELGQSSNDDAMLEFSIDGGASWLGFTNTPKTPTTCPGQGNWTSFSSILPSICENIPNLRFAFKWINNDDGIGNDPSFAVDDFELTVPATTSPVAAFQHQLQIPVAIPYVCNLRMLLQEIQAPGHGAVRLRPIHRNLLPVRNRFVSLVPAPTRLHLQFQMQTDPIPSLKM